MNKFNIVVITLKSKFYKSDVCYKFFYILSCLYVI